MANAIKPITAAEVSVSRAHTDAPLRRSVMHRRKEWEPVGRVAVDQRVGRKRSDPVQVEPLATVLATSL